MNNINFTGIKNIGSYNNSLPVVPEPIRKCHLLVQLTDDADGNDLTEYRQVMKRVEPYLGNMNFIPQDDFVHLMTAVVQDGEDIPELALNWNVLPTKTETMPLFTYAAKLSRKIANLTNKEFVYDDKFIKSENAEVYPVPAVSLSDIACYLKLPAQIIKNVVYSPKKGREVAKEINDNISEQMFDYLK